jgi:hypothetical protein
MTAPQHRTIPLSQPVSWDGREIAEVSIRKPKVRDLKAMQSSLDGVTDQLEQGIVMAATLCGLPREVIEDLDTEDFTAISEVIADFFPRAKARANGEPSSPRPPTG